MADELDVKEETEGTVEESSTEEKTTEETGSESTDETTESEDKSIPYSRFKEVNEQKRELEARLQALETNKQNNPSKTEELNPQIAEAKKVLKEMGYLTQDDVKQMLREKEEDQYVQNEISRLEKTWDGKDGKPKFDRSKVVEFAIQNNIGDIEAAFEKMNKAKIIDYHVQQALKNSKGLKTERSDGSGASEAGTTDGDLREAAASGDKTALRTLIKRIAFPKS